ncbi:hypothetical protein SPRG_13586 [Saprolegnia parasitica CBS 223.65]|uniref:Uncharacterized protein n=1 Tax=Saprolegnia parasitica (strain CBS 223.65) TaxID=695850 RepID=A0A067C3B8_SAPPC|nr:hypothetical protein SPRG_13586 [Saprolegnia parasitica CBS 223.65]KDO21287.1 hypothetical protein SPRG_13586 [Saprolegnia parasitica CBS 223.65]|eukprot:XP_012208029.1 hypothetical protein SPRG_13586 [Saprolegnia parasitica CBS 223.65]
MARRKAESAPTCQYTYKVCSNLRSTKRNGTLHLLCDYHRKKANAIQRASNHHVPTSLLSTRHQ